MSTPLTPANEHSDHEPSSSEGLKPTRRRSSFFQRMGASFQRSGGDRGADLKTLCGKQADFEGQGTITRATTGCGCYNADAKKLRTLLIKGPFCFVFDAANESSPLYAISLHCMKATAVDSTHVQLSTSLGDVEYNIFLKDPHHVAIFIEAVKQQSSLSQSEEARRKLGHGNLINKRASLIFAENVAKEKVKNQPEVPVNNETIDDAMRTLAPVAY